MKESGGERYEEMQCKDASLGNKSGWTSLLFKQKKHKLTCKYSVVNFAN